jgi:lysophospholipase L1-like esterase
MPGNGSCFGVAACKRFEQDVYGSDCPEMVIIMEGVNDMMHPYVFGHMEEVVSAKDLQSGIERLVQIAHEKGSKVYLGTVMPFRNDEFEWLPESEAVRLELNEWIRNQKIAEGFIDFAKIIESEENPQYMMDGYHIGDGLHPNTEGGIAMATAIPLEWIQEGIE